MPERTVIDIGERVDITVVSALRKDLCRAFERGSGTVVIDLTGVDHADTAGIQLLIACVKEAEQKNIQLQLQGDSSAVAATARQLGLRQLLPLSGLAET